MTWADFLQNVIPSGLDLEHLATWIAAIGAVAAVLGGAFVLFDTIASALWPVPESDAPEPPQVTPVVGSRLNPANLREPAAKGFHRHSIVRPFGAHAEEWREAQERRRLSATVSPWTLDRPDRQVRRG